MPRITLILCLCFGFTIQAQNNFFTETYPSTIPVRNDHPKQEKFFKLDAEGLKTFLDVVNNKETDEESIISLPDRLGNLKRYSVKVSSIMEDDFQANYPEIRTYTAKGITNPQETLRLSYTPLGLHVIILGTPNGTQFIRPVDQTRNLYSVYNLKDHGFDDHSFECKLIETAGIDQDSNLNQYQTLNANDGILRDFRIAISATSEYSAFYNNNLTNVISAIVIAVNNANAVLERDLSVSLTMVDNSSLIFFDPNNDPFTNFDNSALLSENQTLLDNVIGDANYDIGHVFNTAGGGVAGLNTSCVPGFKGWGVTGATSASDTRFLFVFLH
jgi:hypothetical protein